MFALLCSKCTFCVEMIQNVRFIVFFVVVWIYSFDHSKHSNQIEFHSLVPLLNKTSIDDSSKCVSKEYIFDQKLSLPNWTAISFAFYVTVHLALNSPMTSWSVVSAPNEMDFFLFQNFKRESSLSSELHAVFLTVSFQCTCLYMRMCVCVRDIL